MLGSFMQTPGEDLNKAMNSGVPASISPAIPEEMETVRKLFREYEQSIGVDLCFQNFAQEIRDLPGEYVRPAGILLLARQEGRAVGCAALRRVDAEICEMKRLYVIPAARGAGIGRRLAEAIIEAGRGARYRIMKLDTLPTMAEAIALYATLGFLRTESYRYNPHQGAIYMELLL